VWTSSIAVTVAHLRGPSDGKLLAAALTASTLLYGGIAKGVINGDEKEKLVTMLSLQVFTTIVLPVLRELKNAETPRMSQLVWYYLTRTISVYALGGALFIYRFPECVVPGVFCKCGYSHNLMHTLVVLGTVLTSKGIAEWCDEVGYLK
jgi:predicted membrane channel-forming protein YqfA (hemolysin III family)